MKARLVSTAIPGIHWSQRASPRVYPSRAVGIALLVCQATWVLVLMRKVSTPLSASRSMQRRTALAQYLPPSGCQRPGAQKKVPQSPLNRLRCLDRSNLPVRAAWWSDANATWSAVML